MKIGFLGLGIMGCGMARNLMKAGHEVTVWNRTPAKCAAFAKEGARVGATPREVVAANEVTFAMLADPAAARAVCLGPDGVAAGAGAGHDYVDVSTVDAATAQAVAAAVTATGARFLEAPVSGTKKPAEDGTLIFLAGGDAALYEKVGPLLDVMGKKRVFLGAVGQGARMKLVVNMIMGTMITALGEGIALASKSGLEGAALLDVLAAGAMACPMFAGKGPGILADSFPTAFPLKHQQKDLRLAVALGDELHQPLAVAAAVNEAFKRAIAMGLADADMSAVARAVRG